MIAKFKDDFFWMLREAKGYYPWVNEHPYRLRKFLYNRHHKMCPECYELNSRDLIRILTNEIVCENETIDLFFKALVRAEIRFISRYIPQRSNEERLTGNLVSEIDNSIFLVKNEFKDLSIKRYSEMKEIDFFYTDLSKGGKVEKDTGADLGFILLLDLPDYPFTVRSLILQAKKVNHTVQIDKNQYETLTNLNENNCGYLFYDMNFRTLASPMVLRVDDNDFKNKYEKSDKNKTNSFGLDFQDICDGYPLSIFLVLCLLNNEYGKNHGSFEDALYYFDDLLNKNKRRESYLDFNGRVGVVSIGKRINHSIHDNEVLRISIG